MKIISIFLCLFCLISNGQNKLPSHIELTKSQKSRFDKAKTYFEAKEYSKSNTLLRSLISTLSPSVNIEAYSLYLRNLIRMGEESKVLEECKSREFILLNYSSSYFKVFYENGNCLLSLKEFQNAKDFFDEIATLEEGKNKLNQLYAVNGHGRALIGLKKHDEALKSFNFVSKNIKFLISKLSSEEISPELKYLKDLNSKYLNYLKKYFKKQREEEFKKLVGEAFILYRDAETLRRKGNFDKSKSLFDQLISKYPKTVYAKAGKLYSIKCVLSSNDSQRKTKDIILSLESLLKTSKPHDLYTGEARLTLIKLYLDELLSFKDAEYHLSQLSKWLSTVRTNDPLNLDLKSLDGLTDKAAELVQVETPEYAKLDFWGNKDRIIPPPEQLINRITCNWYLNDLEESCAKYYGLIYLYKQEPKEALKQFKKIIKLDGNSFDGTIVQTQNDYTRLKFGAEKGYLYAYPEELKLYKGKFRLAVLLADFYYITQNFETSEKISKRLYDNYYGRLDPKQKLYPLFLLGSSAFKTKGVDEAVKVYSQIVRKRETTFTKTRALFALGNISIFSSDEKRKMLGYKCLNTLIGERKVGEYYAKAHITLALHFIDQNETEKSLRILNNYPQNDEKWGPVVSRYIKLFSK